MSKSKHYSIQTEETYPQWAKRFILFHNKRRPDEMGAPEIIAYLSHLAVAGHAAASIQNQVLNAVIFISRQSMTHSRLSYPSLNPFPNKNREGTISALILCFPRRFLILPHKFLASTTGFYLFPTRFYLPRCIFMHPHSVFTLPAVYLCVPAVFLPSPLHIYASPRCFYHSPADSDFFPADSIHFLRVSRANK